MTSHALRGYDGKFSVQEHAGIPLSQAIDIYNRCLAATCRQLGLDLRWTLRQLARPPLTLFRLSRWPARLVWDEDWSSARRACQIAYYVANTEFGVSQSQIASIVGLNRSNVSRALREIECARDDADYDALIEAVAAISKGCCHERV